jgi:hypothetical protein
MEMKFQKFLPYNMNSFTWSKIMYAWRKFYVCSQKWIFISEYSSSNVAKVPLPFATSYIALLMGTKYSIQKHGAVFHYSFGVGRLELFICCSRVVLLYCLQFEV